VAVVVDVRVPEDVELTNVVVVAADADADVDVGLGGGGGGQFVLNGISDGA
jgi:hypothetical protein